MPLPQQFLRQNPRTIDNMIATDGSPKWFQFNVTYKSLAAAAVTGDLDLVVPRGTIVHGAFIRSRQDFLGGGVATATLSMGTTGGPTNWVAAVSVFSGSPKTLPGTTLVPGTFIATSAPASMRVRLTCDINTNLLTQGNADVFVMLSTVPLISGG